MAYLIFYGFSLACHQRLAAISRGGKASRVRSAKIEFLREKQT
jgi:hypothetical protein